MDGFFNDALVWIVVAVLLFGGACYIFGPVHAFCGVTVLLVVLYALIAFNGWGRD